MNEIVNFCHHCGQKVIIGNKFCGKCGTSLASLSEVPKIKTYQQEATVTLVGGDEDGDDNYLDHQSHFIPKIQALAVEITQNFKVPKDTIENLANNPMAMISNEQRSAPPQLDRAEFLKEFAKEAGAIRPK